MQAPGQIDRPRNGSDLIYDLRPADGGSGYEADVEKYAARLLAEAELRAAGFLDQYTEHVRTVSREPARSRGEYVAELVTLGMALFLYGAAARRTPRIVLLAARLLLALRRFPGAKPASDALRARIFRPFLPERAVSPPKGTVAVETVARVAEWFAASGEFREEAARLRNWHGLLRTLTVDEQQKCLHAAVGLFAWFEHTSERALGRYTAGVEGFLASEFAGRSVREDQLFCGRTRVEYHLGMLAAELMNRGLRPQFLSKPRRAVLLPACMRGERAGTCPASVDGVDMTCAGCDPACAINRITKSFAAHSVPVYIVPHASSFSRWLERWQRDHDVGVVAVACLLNILAGGYEMRARGIASQCLVLDYPGCEKHWRSERLPTSVNEERLVQIAGTGVSDQWSLTRVGLVQRSTRNRTR